MSRIKIEGCLWHPQYEKQIDDINDKDKKCRQKTEFARHMARPLQLANNFQKLIVQKMRYIRYRMLGGIFDGVVMECCDIANEIQIRLLVPNLVLYNLWVKQHIIWQQKLALLGLVVNLEVIYVDTVS